MNIKINKRLEKVASFVKDGDSVIDVGCDHALLGIYLVKTKKDVKVIASDINKGPLEKAKENIKKYQVEDKIKTTLGNGIETIHHNTNTIIISGMGGLNMVGILKYNPNKYKQVTTIILSPNNDTNRVRKEITKLGFYIEDETLIKDKNHIYPIIVFKRGKKKYKKEDYIYGPILIQKQEPLFIDFLKTRNEQVTKLISILPKRYFSRKRQLKQESKILNKLLNPKK